MFWFVSAQQLHPFLSKLYPGPVHGLDCQWFTRVTLRPRRYRWRCALCAPLTASAESQLHADQAVPNTTMSHQLPSWAES